MEIELLLLLVVVIAVGLHIRSLKGLIKNLRGDVKYYRDTYLIKNGFSEGWGNYYLVSLDAGSTWYSAEREDGKTVIIGPVDEVIPGLLKHLEAMDVLFRQVEKHGPISLMDTNQLGMLEAAGFTVEYR